MKNILLITLSIFIAGCVMPQMVPGSEKVRISKTEPDEKAYAFIAEVSCENGYNFGTPYDNTKNCRNELRNKAAELKADLVVIENEVFGNSMCRDCVTMFGSAFKKRDLDN